MWNICFENFLPDLLDSILVVLSSKCWQLWILFLKILVSMETWILLFTYIVINDCRLIQRFMKRAKKTLGVVKCILVTMVTRSVAMETEVSLDWFLQIFPDSEIFVHLKVYLVYNYVFKTGCHGNQMSRLTDFYRNFQILIFLFIDKVGYDQIMFFRIGCHGNQMSSLTDFSRFLR